MSQVSPKPQSPGCGTNVLLDYDLSTSELISFLLEYEAHKLGLETWRVTPLIVTFRDDKAETIMTRACARGVSRTAFAVTMDKSLTKRLFDRGGIPHSPYLKLKPSQFEEGLKFARGYNFEVVIKPTQSGQGLGVFTRIEDEPTLRACWNKLAKLLDKMRQRHLLIEKRADGSDFRFYVVGRQVMGVLERCPANVTGDGTSTIDELVAAKNRVRGQNPDLRGRPIKIDGIVRSNLRAKGLGPGSILPQGMTILLRDNANISTGGDSIDRTDEIPARVKQLAVRAMLTVPDLETSAVDLAAKNIYDDTRLGPDNIIFHELEGDAAMGMHHFPAVGKPRNLARAILLTQFPHRLSQSRDDGDYRHDFDENETLCRRIAEGIVSLRKSDKRVQARRGWSLRRLVRAVRG